MPVDPWDISLWQPANQDAEEEKDPWDFELTPAKSRGGTESVVGPRPDPFKPEPRVDFVHRDEERQFLWGPTGPQAVPMTSAEMVLSALNPLFFAGDVAKAAIYGYAKGGLAGASQLVREQLSEWESYIPGRRPKQVVSSEEVARLFVQDFDNLPAWQKFAISLAADTLTDPLSFFALGGLAAKATAIATRGVSKTLSHGAEAVARGFAEADRLANLAFNPYAQATKAIGGTARTIGNVVLNEDGVKVADVVAKTFDAVLDFGVKRRLPDGSVVKVRLADFFTPGMNLSEYQAVKRAPGYFSSPEIGPGVYSRGMLQYQDVLLSGLKHAEEMHKYLHDTLGEEVSLFGLVKRKVVPDGRLPLVQEIKASVQHILDNYGIADAPEALKKVEGAVRKVAQAVGVEEDKAVQALYGFHDLARKFYADYTYKLTGMELYEDVFKRTAKELGLDPEEAWQRYAGLKAGMAPVVGEKGLIELTPAEAPRYQRVSMPPVIRDMDVDLLIGGKLEETLKPDSPLAPKYLALLSPPAQARFLTKHPELEERVVRMQEAVRRVSESPTDAVSDFANRFNDLLNVAPEVKVPGLPDDTAALVGELQDIAEAATKKQSAKASLEKLARLLNTKADEQKAIPQILKATQEAIENVDRDTLKAWLFSKSGKKSTVGYYVLGNLLEAAGEHEAAVVAYSVAAKDAKGVFGRYLYHTGAVPLDPDDVKKVKDIFGVEESALVVVKEAEVVDADTVRAAIKIARETPGTIAQDVLSSLVEGGPGARVARAFLTGSKEEISQLVKDAIEGRLPATGDGVNAILTAAQKLIGETDVAKAAGYEDLAKYRAQFADNLLEAEKHALREYWKIRPHWAGMASPKDLFGEVKDDKWSGNPFSPLQFFADIKQGYARKIYMGTKSPDAAIAAVLKGRVALIPETDAERILRDSEEWLTKSGAVPMDKAPAFRAAVQDIVDYIRSSDGRYVYTTEVFAKMMQARGVKLDPEAWQSYVNEVLWRFGDLTKSLRSISDYRAGQGFAGTVLARSVPLAFQSRVEGAEALIQLMDVPAAMADLARYSARHMMASYIQQEIYRALNEAGLIFDKEPIESIVGRGIRFIKVPDEPVVARDGTKYYPYGPLTGKYVPEAVFNDMAKALAADPMSSSAWSSFLAYWRKALLNSPKSAFVNTIGNFYLTYLNMGPQHFAEMVASIPQAARALDELYRTGESKALSKGAVLLLRNTGLASQARGVVADAIKELARVDPTAFEKGGVQRLIEKIDGIANDYGRRLAQALTGNEESYARMISPLEVFAYAEDLVRAANYLAAKRTGADEARALWVAANATFNYSELPYALKLLRDYGILAFPGFIYFTSVAVGRALAKNPSALTLPARASQASFFANTDGPEDHARVATYMQDWLRGSLPLVLPIKREDGSYLVLPLTGIFPVIPAEPESVFGEIATLGILRPFIEAGTGLLKYFEGEKTAGEPVWSARYGQVMFPPLASPTEAVLGAASYVAKQFTPAYAVRILPITDAPTLVMARLGDEYAVTRLTSTVGRLWARYKHPVAVAEMERRLGKQIGYSPTEAALSLAITPRAVSPSPEGVGSRRWMSLDRELKDLTSLINQRARRGEPVERLLAAYNRRVEQLKRELEPFTNINKVFGPPPEPTWPTPGGER